MSTRRRDVDWLRICAVWLLIPFHAAMVFNPAPFYHVRSAETSMGMLVFAGFVSLWHMPLLFLLAGWSLHASLGRRSPGALLRERSVRLLVPLVLGTAIYGPVIKFLELRGGQDMSFHGLRVRADLIDSYQSVLGTRLPEMAPFDEGFLEFVPTFFTQLDRVTWSHLWFLAYLFTFTVLYLPIFGAIRRRVSSVDGRAAPPLVYAPLVLLVPIQVFLRPHWPGVQNLYDDWANFAYYSTFLFVGFLLGWSSRFEAALHGECRRALVGAAVALVVLLLGVANVVRAPSVILAGTAVAGWCTIVAVLGWGSRWLRRAGPGLAYRREAALPVYVLHQPVLVLLAAVLVGLPMGIVPKFVALCLGTGVLTWAAYEGVRRVGPLRLMHGLRRTS